MCCFHLFSDDEAVMSAGVFRAQTNCEKILYSNWSAGNLIKKFGEEKNNNAPNVMEFNIW